LIELGGLNTGLPHIEQDLAVRVEAIFERCPALQGFSIQDASGLPKHLQSAALEGLAVPGDDIRLPTASSPAATVEHG
jgi:hypothetical protein